MKSWGGWKDGMKGRVKYNNSTIGIVQKGEKKPHPAPAGVKPHGGGAGETVPFQRKSRGGKAMRKKVFGITVKEYLAEVMPKIIPFIIYEEVKRFGGTLEDVTRYVDAFRRHIGNPLEPDDFYRPVWRKLHNLPLWDERRYADEVLDETEFTLEVKQVFPRLTLTVNDSVLIETYPTKFLNPVFAKSLWVKGYCGLDGCKTARIITGEVQGKEERERWWVHPTGGGVDDVYQEFTPQRFSIVYIPAGVSYTYETPAGEKVKEFAYFSEFVFLIP